MIFEVTTNLTQPSLAISRDNLESKLSIIEALLDEFHESKILYCHWKSNEHLDASMIGNTDLDILFDESQKTQLIILLKKLHFKKFAPIKQKQYKDIEDFIGLDLPSGKVVHLHAHFKLTMGEAFLKSYQLRIEGAILNSRIFDETNGIFCINPTFEIILLYFREALKIRNRDKFRLYWKKKMDLKSNIIREYKWLKLRTTNEQIAIALRQIIDEPGEISKFLVGDFNLNELNKLSSLLKQKLKSQRTLFPFQALALRWYNEVSILVYKKVSRLLNLPIVVQRINPEGGLIVAVIGADGSGKSTLINNLHTTFSKKLDVFQIYFGRGRAGGISWQRKPIVALKKILIKAKTNNVNSPGTITATNNKAGFNRNIIKCIEAIIVANEKRKKIKLMLAAKKKGMLVICDRFPQNQLKGYNDGPVLSDLSASSNLLLRAMSRLEIYFYSRLQTYHPDILFKLIADAKTIDARKPSKASLEMLETKVEGIKRLNFAQGCKVINVDATQPLSEVLYKVKRQLWEDVCRSNH